MLDQSILIAFSATTLWAIVNLFQKDLSAKMGPSATAVIIVGGGLIPIAALLAIYGVVLPGMFAIFTAIAAGILFGVASLLFYKALETQHVVNAKAIGLIQPVIILFFSVLILSETITLPAVIGSVVVLIGSLLICIRKDLRFNRKLLPAFYSNLAWAASWILIAFSVKYSGQVAFPQFVLRASALVFVALIYFFLSKDRKKIAAKGGRWIWWIALIGVIGGMLDGVGNLLQSYLVLLNTLYVGGITGIFGPFIVVVLAYLVYKEKLTKIQALGLAISAIGAFVVAIA
jgi:drug/metabolite transporter (DMT)-like permease